MYQPQPKTGPEIVSSYKDQTECPQCGNPVDPVGKYDPDTYEENWIPQEYDGEVYHRVCVRGEKAFRRDDARAQREYEES